MLDISYKQIYTPCELSCLASCTKHVFVVHLHCSMDRSVHFTKKLGNYQEKQENKHYRHQIFLPHSFLKTIIFKVLKLRIYYERYFLLQHVLVLCDNFILFILVFFLSQRSLSWGTFSLKSYLRLYI